ncbi:MAG TPA: WecB/TagA/CpsF family glycosyltransferase [Pyrinomonadaceae bacterium]|nr:WecB/TagA/CpsF family glycosyltransferase [Pyrinomonadaceae bacterium]
MIERTNILGVGVSAVNMRMALDIVDEWISHSAAQYVCVTGVHGLIESHRKQAIREMHNAAGLVVPDGMPLVWLSRLKGFRHVGRVYGPDLMLPLCERSVGRGYRHFFYGGAPGIGERLACRLQSRFSGLKVVGTYSPPFRALAPHEDEDIVKRINDASPDIVWVGVSTPKQEIWMAEHVKRLRAAVLIGVGAAFDFHAGIKGQAPRWMMRAGLEWLFRMMSEPRRLGPRYLVNNPMFVGLLILQILGKGPVASASSSGKRSSSPLDASVAQP